MSVGHVWRETLEELLVYRVKEVLLLSEVAQIGAGPFNCRIVWVQPLQEFGGRKAAGGERFDDALNLRRDHVPLGEFGVLKQVPHQALGEQMLDEHLIHVAVGEFGIQRCPAKGHKRRERVPEPLVLFVRFVNVLA